MPYFKMQNLIKMCKITPLILKMRKCLCLTKSTKYDPLSKTLKCHASSKTLKCRALPKIVKCLFYQNYQKLFFISLSNYVKCHSLSQTLLFRVQIKSKISNEMFVKSSLEIKCQQRVAQMIEHSSCDKKISCLITAFARHIVFPKESLV